MRDAAAGAEHVPSGAEQVEENAVMLAWVHALSFNDPSDYRDPAAGGTSGNSSAAAPPASGASAPAPADKAAGQGPFTESEAEDDYQGNVDWSVFQLEDAFDYDDPNCSDDYDDLPDADFEAERQMEEEAEHQ